jgi:Tol biopolymer transport system component
VTTSLQSDDSWELRLISADGPPRRPLVARQRAYRPEVLDWASDGRHVLCWFRQRNGSTDMVLVPISGGPPRIINTFHGTQPWSARLSPDGRHVAVVEGARDAGSPADLVVFDADDGAHRVVVRSIASFTAPAWTSDGAHLFFLRPSAETPGSRDGWVVPVANGAAAGEPVLAMANLGSVNWVRLSTSNVLSRVIGNRSAEVYTQPIDLSGGTSPAAPSRVAPGKMGNHVGPAWSADGRWLAYFTIRPAPAAGGLPLRTLTIKDLGTGESRETPTPLSFLGGYTPQWAPDSRSVVVWGSDDGTDGRLGYYRVTLPTGAATPVVIRGRADAANSQFSPSGLFLYRQPGRGVVARDLSTSRERVVGGAAGSGELWDFRLAPNGRSMAFTIVTRDGGGQSTRLEVQDVGEAPREIFRVKGREQMRVQAWTHDGAGILYTYADGERPLELFLIPATGGTPRGMGISFIRSGSNEPNGLTLSPDGRQIAYTERVVEYELWTEPLSLPRH